MFSDCPAGQPEIIVPTYNWFYNKSEGRIYGVCGAVSIVAVLPSSRIPVYAVAKLNGSVYCTATAPDNCTVNRIFDRPGTLMFTLELNHIARGHSELDLTVEVGGRFCFISDNSPKIACFYYLHWQLRYPPFPQRLFTQMPHRTALLRSTIPS